MKFFKYFLCLFFIPIYGLMGGLGGFLSVYILAYFSKAGDAVGDFAMLTVPLGILCGAIAGIGECVQQWINIYKGTK